MEECMIEMASGFLSISLAIDRLNINIHAVCNPLGNPLRFKPDARQSL
jgi:hypothetical protein